MKNQDFIGAQRPLSSISVAVLAHRAGVSEDHFRAFIEVESVGKAFDHLGRPTMLFEPHVFWRNLPTKALRDRAEKAGLAYSEWRPGKYPKDSYPRLVSAMELHEDAALKACSIGLSQILVENHISVGYDSPQAMWSAFMDDAGNHIEAMLKFVLANGIADDIRAGRWAVVARVYNGPKYSTHGYDKKLAAAYAKHSGAEDSGWRPDQPDPTALTIGDKTTIQSVQNKLVYLGYHEVGRQDGTWGTKTRAAVLAFRADNGMPIVADIDRDLLSALMLATPRPVSVERASTTVDDLKSMGAKEVVAASRAESAGYVTVAGGAAAVVTSLLEKTDDLSALTDKFSGLIGVVKELSPWLILAFGAYVVYQQWIVKRVSVEDYRTGRNVGR